MQMMKSAYPDTTITDLLLDVAIISSFWADVDHGSEIMMQHDTGTEVGNNEDDINNWH